MAEEKLPLPTRNPEGNEDYARRKKYVPFGNKMLGLKDLGNNILNVKHKKLNNIWQFRKVKISPLFASIVHGYLAIPDLSEKTFVENPQTKNLSEEEKELMGCFLRRTCVRQGSVPMKVKKENLADKKRELKIMIGIRQAGNNSPEMALNILKIAKYLKQNGALSREMMRDIVQELSTPE